MHQLRYLSGLGRDLLAARRGARLTQAALAVRVGVSLPTLRQAERGRGAMSGFMALAAALEHRVDGRSLPPGDGMGERLAAMRRRRRWGRRVVAAAAGVSPTTVEALESGALGRVDTVARVAEALGVRLHLVPVDAAAPFWAAAGTSSAHHGWTTPPELLERLYEVVGGDFGLDPCSPTRRGPVRARLRYTAADDGLALPWRGTVFVNPPYGRTLGRWVAKARREVGEGRASLVLALVPARTDTRWWHADIADRADVWLLRGRLAFGDGSQAAPFPSAIAVWGADGGHRAGMAAAFPDAWHVPPRRREESETR